MDKKQLCTHKRILTGIWVYLMIVNELYSVRQSTYKRWKTSGPLYIDIGYKTFRDERDYPVRYQYSLDLSLR